MLENSQILNLIIWAPILAGFWVLYVGDRQEKTIKLFSLGVSVFVFVLSLFLLSDFDTTTHAMQFVVNTSWIEVFNINYHIGVDGISLPLIVLTTLITILVILAAWEVIEHRGFQYMAAFLILEGLMVGTFSALDAMLFYFFWEAMLIPMFLIIGIWGGTRRGYAAIKFFLYTLFGSVLMLVALLFLYSQSSSFEILDFHELSLSLTKQRYIFVAFLLAFAVKVPMWPVHTWLPDAHVEAPTGGSVILAAILLKMGGYGFVRFSLPILPDASLAFDGFMIALSLIAIVYIGFVTLVQQDMKKLVAYSSISHMGFVTLGFFVCFQIVENTNSMSGAVMAMEGAMMQMISHGFISGALFLCVGVIYDRMHSREIADYGGVVNTMPKFAALTMLFAMANAGLPGTTGFVGEFLIILSSFQASFWIAFLAATIFILGAAYTLWMYKRVFFGDVTNDNVAELKDITVREGVILSLLAIVVLLFGIWPAPIFEIMHPSIEHLVEHVLQLKVG